MAESFAARITRLRWTSPQDAVAEPFADVGGTSYRHPDGICLDAAGILWYADVESGCVVALDPLGRPLAAVATGFAHATSCVVVEDEQPWLAATVTDTMPGPDLEATSSGAVVAFPLPNAGRS